MLKVGINSTNILLPSVFAYNFQCTRLVTCKNLETVSTYCYVQAELRTLSHERENNVLLQAIRLFLSIKSHVMS